MSHQIHLAPSLLLQINKALGTIEVICHLQQKCLQLFCRHTAVAVHKDALWLGFRHVGSFFALCPAVLHQILLHEGQIQIGIGADLDAAGRVNLTNLFPQLAQALGIHQIHLGNDCQMTVFELAVNCFQIVQLVKKIDRIHQADGACKVIRVAAQLFSCIQNFLDVGRVTQTGAFHKQIFQVLRCHIRQRLHKRQL